MCVFLCLCSLRNCRPPQSTSPSCTCTVHTVLHGLVVIGSMLSGVYPMHAHTHAFVILNVCHALVDEMEGHACLLCVCTPVCAMYV